MNLFTIVTLITHLCFDVIDIDVTIFLSEIGHIAKYINCQILYNS